MNEHVHLEANLFDVGNDVLRAHFQRFNSSLAFDTTNHTPGQWQTDCQEYPPDFCPYICYVSTVPPDELYPVDLPRSESLANYQAGWRTTARQGAAYDFGHLASASAVRVASSIVEAGVSNQIGRIFPNAQGSQLFKRRLTWAARDLAVLFQCTGIPQVLMDGIQSDAAYNDHMRFTAGLGSQVPRALMRPSNDSTPWTSEQMFSALREFMFGDAQRDAQLWLPDVHEAADIIDERFPIGAPPQAPDLRMAPRPLHFVNALNNLQALSWYIQTIIRTLQNQLNNYRYRISLKLVTQRFKTNEEILVLQGGDLPIQEQGMWTYHFYSVYHTFDGGESAGVIAQRLILAILHSLYDQGQIKYGDESDILPVIRGITIIPVQMFNSRAYPGLRVPAEVRFHPHAARRVPAGLFNADPRVNYYNDAVAAQARDPHTMRDSEVEAIAHTRQWIIDWLSQTHAHALSSLPPHFQELVCRYELKHGFDSPYDHQCLSNCLLFLAVAARRVNKMKAGLLETFASSLVVQRHLALAPFTDEDAFIPTNSVIDRLHRQALTNQKHAQDTILSYDQPDFLKEVGELRDCLTAPSHPNASVFMRGNILETSYAVLQQVSGFNSITYVFIRGFEGEASTYLVRVSPSSTFVPGSSAPFHPSLLDLEGLTSIADTHDENEPLIGILNGHAFLLSKNSAMIITGDTVLPSYGSRSIRYHLYNSALSDPTKPKFELKKPTGTAVTPDYQGLVSIACFRDHLDGPNGIVIPPDAKHRSLCYDCETGQCVDCGVVHAVVVCLGVNLSTIKTFVGLECPRRSAPGCISQMLLFLQTLQQEDSLIILSAHYGAKFDHWFLHRALRSLQIPFEVVLAGRRLQRLKFWNTVTLDTFNLFPGTLDSVSSNFLKDKRIKEVLPPSYVEVGKYQAFPYRLLDSQYELADCPVSLLESSDDIWGASHKSVPVLPGMDDSWSIARRRCFYMQTLFPQFFDGEWFKLRLATETYCVEDVKLLTVITVMHFFLVCRTPQQNIIPNILECMTAPSLAWKTFLTCYFDPALQPQGRPRGESGYAGITVLHPSGLEVKVDISMLLDQSILGGYTYSNCRKVCAPKGLMAIDRNSSYPGEMLKDLPISYVKRTQHPDRDLQIMLQEGTVRETDLVLLSSIDFRAMSVSQRTFTVNMMGSNVGVDYLPLYWYDPVMKDIKFNVRWARELVPYLSYGAIIKVRMVYHFTAAPIFKQFAITTYAARQEAKRNKDTLLDSLNKLLMNSSFGKTLQEVKSTFIDVTSEHVIQSILSRQEEIVGVETINVETYNPADPHVPIVRQVLQLETVGNRFSSGELASVGSCILAGARASLASVIYHLEHNFVDECGQALRSPQGDTDSAFFKQPNLTVEGGEEAWADFSRIFLSESILGAWKVEARIPCGYMLCPGKKTYAMIDSSEPPSETIVKMAHKGAPQWLVEKQGISYYHKLVYGEGTSVTIPTSFKLDKDQRMQQTSITRKLRANNIARYWPSDDVEEWSQSFPTLDHFMCNVYAHRGLDPAESIKAGWYSTLSECAWEVSFTDVRE